MFCKNCGKEHCDEAVTCPNCGVLLNPNCIEVLEINNQGKNSQEYYNGFAVAAFSCAFAVPGLGIVFGVIGLNQAKRNGGKGKKLSIAALVISGIMSALYSAISSVLFA